MRQFSIGLALMFYVVLGVMVATRYLPMFVLLILSGMSLATYAIYWWDKAAARKYKSRIPENTLHLLALGGGWPGALLAQQLLRHKTQKRSFRVVFWLTVVVSIAALVLLSVYLI